MTGKHSDTRKKTGKPNPKHTGTVRKSDGRGGKPGDDGAKTPPGQESASVIVRPPTHPY